MLRLEVFPGRESELYRCAVYDWFDRKPLFVSGTDSAVEEAKSEAEREAARFAGYVGPEVEWMPGQFGK